MSVMTTVLVTAMVATTLTSSAVAAPSIRSTVPTMPRNEVTSYSIQSWGPMEQDPGSDKMVIVDADLVSKEYITDLKSKGKKVTCYVNAGSKELWREDAEAFDEAEMGKAYKGYEGQEQWFDITQWEQVKGPMSDRLEHAQAQGCQYIEADNVDCDDVMCVSGYTHEELSVYQSEYIQWLIDTTHSLGMGYGLKNAITHIDEFASKVEFAINEQCGNYETAPGVSECGIYQPFISQNKAVFGVEYTDHDGKVCTIAKESYMVTIYKGSDGNWHDCF